MLVCWQESMTRDYAIVSDHERVAIVDWWERSTRNTTPDVLRHTVGANYQRIIETWVAWMR
jgi:hypothetical protein